MLVATVNSWKEPTSLAGRRLVSEKEWDLLQKEVGRIHSQAVMTDPEMLRKELKSAECLYVCNENL